MKKLISIMAAVFVALSGFMMTSCQEGDEIINELAGPTQTWCEMPVSYAKDGGEAPAQPNLYVYFYYTDTEVKGTSGSKNLKTTETIEPGLTIVVTPVTNSNGDSLAQSVIKELAGNCYIKKTFPKDSESDEDGFKITGSREKWSAIYWMKSDLRKTENHDKNPPAQLTNGGNGVGLNWDQIKEDFSWKRLLADYLLNSL